jgi:hypothetical protein
MDPTPVPMSQSSGPPVSRRTLVIAVVVATVLSSILTLVVSPAISHLLPLQSNPPPPPSSPPNWATFGGASRTVDPAIQKFPGAPWTLVFVEGVASQAPWSPPLSSFGLDLGRANWSGPNGCDAQLSGISIATVWNASLYPASRSPDVFTSGAAPLWTFLYQNTSDAQLLASWYVGAVILNAILPPGGPCAHLLPFEQRSGVFLPAQIVDSSVAARVALGLGGSTILSNFGTGVALYVLGSQLGGYSKSPQRSWFVDYGVCGLASHFGETTTDYASYVNITTGVALPVSDKGTGPCFSSEYFVPLHPRASGVPPGGNGSFREWNFTVSFSTSLVPSTLGVSNLSTALFGLELWANRSGVLGNPIYPTAAICTPSHSGFGNCTAPLSEWYGVLLDPSGGWLDSFPSTANGSSWTVPGVHVGSGDRLVLVTDQGVARWGLFGTTTTTPAIQVAGYASP